MHIRIAHAQDAAAIHALFLDAFSPFRDQYTADCFDATVLDPERIQERMREGPVWVAEQDGRMLGTLSAVKDGRGLYVRGLAVHPDARRQGIGHRLLTVAEGYANALDLPTMWLSTTVFLDDSKALYKAEGFEDSSGPPDLHGTPLVSFEKDLRGST